jgi:hypothetical protein
MPRGASPLRRYPHTNPERLRHHYDGPHLPALTGTATASSIGPASKVMLGPRVAVK